MNDSRRKRLSLASAKISETTALLEEVRDEEQDSLDSLPEAVMAGEKGEAMETTISILDDAINSLAEALSSIEEAQI